MFPAAYFAPRYFAPRYFPEAGAEAPGGIWIAINGENIHHEDALGRLRDYHYGTGGQIWNLILGSQGTCDVPVICPPGDIFAPAVDDAVDIYETSHSVTKRVWTGLVTGLSRHWIGDDGWFILTIKGTGFEVQLATTQVGQSFTTAGPNTITNAILAASGSTDITSGLIETGTTIDSLPINRATDGLDQTALISGKIWYIDPADRSLNMHDPASRPISDAIVSSDSQHDIRWETIQWEQDSTDQRNAQQVSGSAGSVTSGAGNPTQSATLGGSGTAAGLQQLADAIVAHYSPNPAKLSFVTDRTDISIGRLVTLSVSEPAGAGALLNGDWLVQEVDAAIEPGIDQDHPRRPAPFDEGHFVRTLHLVKTPAPQNFVKAAEQLTNVSPPPTPGLPPPGQLFERVLQIYDGTPGNRVGNSVPVQASGKALDAIAMLHKTITADYVIEVIKGGITLVIVTVSHLTGSPPTSTPIDTSMYFPVLTGSPPTAATFTLGEPIVWNILSSDGQIDAKGIMTLTLRWQA